MGHEQHTVAIFAPVLGLSVTVEQGIDETAAVHFHPAGQGFWIARMLRHLGERPLICGPLGGETGRVIRGLLPHWGIDLSPIETDSASPTTIQDRRSGDRVLIAETPRPELDRHALDEAYSQFLDLSIRAGLAVITGQDDEIIPLDRYRRLAHDLASTGVDVVADLHGEELTALLDGGEISVLKVSSDDLDADGMLDSSEEAAVLRALDRLESAGARSVIISRGSEPVLARVAGKTMRATPPELEAADFRGTGDSMTAALAAAIRRGLDPAAMLKLACGAGAANVTRHGLGSATEGLVEELAERVEVEYLEVVG